MKNKEYNFHALTQEQTLEKLNSNYSGLAEKEAGERIKKYGPNKLPEKKKAHLVFIFLKQLNNFFVYILLIAGIISFFLDHRVDMYVILAVIIINSTISFLQEYKAEKAIKALKKMVVPLAKVYRSGQLLQINARDLVPGDIISIEEGDKVPADARLIEINDLRTVESSLTGASMPSEKSLKVLPKETALADRINTIFMGTFIAAGSAKAVVISTGSKTAIGTLAKEIEEIKPEKSHFKEKTDKLALQMGILAVIGAGLVFVIGYFVKGFDFSEIFLFTIASLISGIPEGLPAILALVLAIGAFRMAKRKAIIRKIYATETLGVVNTIITDKTGTLTQNTMNVEKISLLGEKEILVSGKGWEPFGEFTQRGEKIMPLRNPCIAKLTSIAALGTRANILKDKGNYKIIGDPTEAALLVLAEKSGVKKEDLLKKEKIIDEIPFSSKLKYRASLLSLVGRSGKKEIYVIGAPEEILKLSSYGLKKGRKAALLPSDKKEISKSADKLAGETMRVVALAYREFPKTKKEISDEDVSSLIFTGLVGMKDPPRQEVSEAIKKARSAGIKIIMVTGDHKETAIAIAKEIGLVDRPEKNYPLALTETELLEMEKNSKKKFEEAVKNVPIFARLTPGMKLRIAGILQKSGAIVAMTGDGVNDAPALKKADVGISMGIIGTDVARESSEIILSDDNFASIVSAIEEGRIVFTNTRQTSTFLVTTNFAEHVCLITSISLGLPLPLLPTQILWLNLVTDTAPALGLAAEPNYNHAISEKPRNSKENILTKSIIPFVALMTIAMVIVTIGVFKYYLPYGIDKARTAAFAVMMFTQLFNTLNVRSLKQSVFNIGLFSNKYANIALAFSVIVGVIVLYIPFFQSVFGFSSLGAAELGIIFLLSSTVFIIGELYKVIKNYISPVK